MSDQVIPEAGLDAALDRLRAAHIAILWMTDAPFDDDQAIYAELSRLGLNPDGHDPVYARMMAGDSKAARQREVAAHYCVLAVAGDSRADMVEGYYFLRSPDLPRAVEGNWGAGWFVLPAPIHHAAMATADTATATATAATTTTASAAPTPTLESPDHALDP